MVQADPKGSERLLQTARWELLPFESFDEQLTYIPDGAHIAITASPQKGVDATVDLTVETANAHDFELVPHISARAVEDRDHLETIMSRLQAAGVTDIFVPGGDNENPAGEFTSSYELLVAMDELGFAFDEVGITGYPEGHHFIDDDEIWRALKQKEQYGTYIVTQICYDPDTVISWIERVRAKGVDLPIVIGIPGVMNYQKLIGISRRVGVGDSVRFLQKTSGIMNMVRRMIGSRGVYKPDKLIDKLSPLAADPDYGIRALHLYTFNQAEATATWREERLDEG